MRNIKCPKCNKNLEYWTVENYILCPDCGVKIDVEPLITEELNEIKETEEDEN